MENNWSQFPLFQNNLDEEDHIYNIFQYIEILKVVVRPALWNRRRGKILLGDTVFFSYIKNKKGRAVMRTGFLEKWPIVKLKLREVLQATPWHWDLWIFQGFWSGDQDVLLTFQNICRARRPKEGNIRLNWIVRWPVTYIKPKSLWGSSKVVQKWRKSTSPWGTRMRRKWMRWWCGET